MDGSSEICKERNKFICVYKNPTQNHSYIEYVNAKQFFWPCDEKLEHLATTAMIEGKRSRENSVKRCWMD